MTDEAGNTPGDSGARGDPPRSVALLRPAITVGLVTGLGYGLLSRVIVGSGEFSSLFAVMTWSFLFLVRWTKGDDGKWRVSAVQVTPAAKK